MQQQRIHASITIEELVGYGVLNVFSVGGPCRRFIGDTIGHLQSVVQQKAEWKEISVVKIDCELL
jgi:hypothetical protein